MDLVNGSDRVSVISVRDGGVLLSGVVAEQQHLLAVEGISGPGDAREQAGSGRTAQVVGVSMVDEVYWHNCCWRLRLQTEKGRICKP